VKGVAAGLSRAPLLLPKDRLNLKERCAVFALINWQWGAHKPAACFSKPKSVTACFALRQAQFGRIRTFGKSGMSWRDPGAYRAGLCGAFGRVPDVLDKEINECP
jgi:hypothetical protein